MGCNDIEIWKSEFVANTQFLWNILLNWSKDEFEFICYFLTNKQSCLRAEGRGRRGLNSNLIGLISSLIVPGIVFLKADVIAAWSFLFCFYFETNIFVVKIINGWIPGILWYWQLVKWSLFGNTQLAEKIEKRVSCVSNLKFNPDFKHFKLAKTTCMSC